MVYGIWYTDRMYRLSRVRRPEAQTLNQTSTAVAGPSIYYKWRRWVEACTRDEFSVRSLGRAVTRTHPSTYHGGRIKKKKKKQ